MRIFSTKNCPDCAAPLAVWDIVPHKAGFGWIWDVLFRVLGLVIALTVSTLLFSENIPLWLSVALAMIFVLLCIAALLYAAKKQNEGRGLVWLENSYIWQCNLCGRKYFGRSLAPFSWQDYA